MLLYQLAVTIILLVPFAISMGNYIGFSAIRRREHPAHRVRISVLVPARNEEGKIAACVDSLMSQEYEDYEVIVLDDHSDDGTPIILAELKKRYPSLTILQGAALPPEWVGKSWGCHQLARRAGGEWLLFVDADTVHDRRSLDAAMAFAERTGARFFTAVPRQRMPGFWEQIAIPMVIFLYFAYLPNRWITQRRDPQFFAANGQFLCVARDAYDLIGGHESVRSQLVEDLWLGRAAKRLGIRTALASAIETVECRTYPSLAAIIAGSAKNLFPGFDYSLTALTFFLISTLLLYVAPLIFLIAAIAKGLYTVDLFWLPLAQLTLAAAMRGMLAHRFGMDMRQLLYQPIGALVISALALNSARLAYSRRGVAWKGRGYGKKRG
jgi:chlorobactene glucosyltransferase